MTRYIPSRTDFETALRVLRYVGSFDRAGSHAVQLGGDGRDTFQRVTDKLERYARAWVPGYADGEPMTPHPKSDGAGPSARRRRRRRAGARKES